MSSYVGFSVNNINGGSAVPIVARNYTMMDSTYTITSIT